MNGLKWLGRLAFILVLIGLSFQGTVAQEEPVEITFWMTSQDGYPDWIAAFEEANPNVTVVAEYIGNYDEMAQKVQAAIAGGATPDVAQMGQRHGLPQVIDAGVVIPVEDYLSDEDIADIRPGLWSRFAYKDQTWVVPFASSTPGLWYNQAAFVEAGLDPATPPATWDELIEYGKALTVDRDGDGQMDQWGFATCEDVPWYVRPMVLQAGGALYDESGQPTINSEAAVDTLQFFQDAVHMHGISSPVGHQTGEDDFKAGNVAMLFCSTANRASFQEEVADSVELGVAHLPGREKQAVGLGGNGLVAFNTGSDAEQAAATGLVQFLTSAELTAEMGVTTGYVAVRESAMDDPRMQELFADDPLAQTIYDQLPLVADTSINPADAILWGGLLNAVEIVQTDATAEPQAVLDTLQAELESYLATYE